MTTDHRDHPRHKLEPLLASPVRLAIAAALSAADKVEFALVRDLVEITDSALSKQATSLEQAGLLTVTKGRAGRRPRTWLALTKEGRTAYDRHLTALRAVVATTVPGSPDQQPAPGTAWGPVGPHAEVSRVRG